MFQTTERKILSQCSLNSEASPPDPIGWRLLSAPEKGTESARMCGQELGERFPVLTKLSSSSVALALLLNWELFERR